MVASPHKTKPFFYWHMVLLQGGEAATLAEVRPFIVKLRGLFLKRQARSTCPSTISQQEMAQQTPRRLHF